MNEQEIKDIMTGYNKLAVECRIIAKKYLDFGNGSYGYPGHVNEIKIMPNSDNFYYTYKPSTSGIGGDGYLPLELVTNGGIGLEKIVEENTRKRREEEEKNTCKSCGHKKNGLFINIFNHF